MPCKSVGGGKYNCTFWPAGDGIHGGSPVMGSDGARVGYLNQGTNWVVCELPGRTVSNGSSQNNWWAYTEANDQAWGWVNAVWAHGGDNFGDFQHVPLCSGHGKPPQTPSSPPPTPNQVPCTAIGGGKFNCTFWPAGDGISGGAPVLSGAGRRVGYLNQGTDWVLCQQAGREQANGSTHNKWWAYTKANDLNSGWVNAVWAQGGTNDGKFAGVPGCTGRHGSPPHRPAPKPRPPARSKGSCSSTRENQRVTVRFRFHERHFTVYQRQPPVVSNTQPPANHKFGALHIGAATCHGPHGWRVLSPASVSVNSYGIYRDSHNKVAPRGSGSAQGWGIALERSHKGTLTVRATACTRGHLWSTIKEILGLPIPTPNKLLFIPLTAWAGSKLLPEDKVKCGNLGSTTLLIDADKHGRLRVRANPSMSGIDLTYIESPDRTVIAYYDRDILAPSISRH